MTFNFTLTVSQETNIDDTKTKTFHTDEKVEYAQVNKPKKPRTSEKPAIHTRPPAPAIPVQEDEGNMNEDDDKSVEGESSYYYHVPGCSAGSLYALFYSNCPTLYH